MSKRERQGGREGWRDEDIISGNGENMINNEKLLYCNDDCDSSNN